MGEPAGVEGDVLKMVISLLTRDGFYKGQTEASFTPDIKEALVTWMHTNNFEVKEREDDYLFGSVYRYMLKQIE